jgi:hypothetical protein
VAHGPPDEPAVSEEFGLYFARIPAAHQPPHRARQRAHAGLGRGAACRACSFVLGNPPFVGAKFMDDAQRTDTRAVFAGVDNAGLLDLVAAWYVKAARAYMATGISLRRGPNLHRLCFCIHQQHYPGRAGGRAVGLAAGAGRAHSLCAPHLQLEQRGKGKAAVHCVIVGFGLDRPARQGHLRIRRHQRRAHTPCLRSASTRIWWMRRTWCCPGAPTHCDVPEIRERQQPLTEATTSSPRRAQDTFTHEPGAARLVPPLAGSR